MTSFSRDEPHRPPEREAAAPARTGSGGAHGHQAPRPYPPRRPASRDSALTFDDIVALAPRLGITDAPCPLCGPSRHAETNRRRKVMRIWRPDSRFASFRCARCGEKGWAADRGVRPGDGAPWPRRPAPRIAPEPLSDGRDNAKRIARALTIWHDARPAEGTPAEVYLRSRGITIPVPPSIRFHPGLKHSTGCHWPAMVALVTRGGAGDPIAIHRTFLARDRRAKAPVDPAKMTLGPCRGGAVRLGPAGNPLMVGEGIETCISAMQATGHPAWAALSTSGMRGLELPAAVRDVIVLADSDDSGQGEKAALDCARRWQREGRRVRIARPPKGMDFNDLLMGRAPRIWEGTA